MAKLCVDWGIHGIPIELLIYAGRIQNNHWEKGEPNKPVARNIMRQLYSVDPDNMIFDVAYDLESPEPRPVSHYFIRLELKWRVYEDHLRDMTSLIANG